MQDQASSLRSGQIIAVVSGKGGVGKTLLATNLSAVFVESGKRTLLLDADVGFTNADILLGAFPRYTIKDFVNHKCSMEDLLIKTPYNIDLVSLGGDVSDILTANEFVLKEFVTHFLSVLDDYDVVVMDMPPGFSDDYMPFLALAQDFVILTTIEPTAVVNTYTMVKLLNVKGVTGDNIHIVANMVQDVKEAAKLMERFIAVVEKFINNKVSSVTIMREHPLVLRSIYERTLFVKKYRNIQPSFSVMRVASSLLKEQIPPRERETLLQKFMNFLRGV
ncbi:MAG: P-loop NTPase [Fervidobacterium sp.]